jgi:hypothetical protein
MNVLKHGIIEIWSMFFRKRLFQAKHTEGNIEPFISLPDTFFNHNLVEFVPSTV